MRTVVVDKIASVTQACGLGNEVRVATDNIPSEEGVVVVVEDPHQQVHLQHARAHQRPHGQGRQGRHRRGRARPSQGAVRLFGPRAREREARRHHADAQHRRRARRVRLGESRQGQAVRLPRHRRRAGFPVSRRAHRRAGARRLSQARLRTPSSTRNGVPVVALAGTCMEAGKTAAAAAIISRMRHRGLVVDAFKATGVSLRRDIMAFEDAGARNTLIFTDFGIVSTTRKVGPALTRTMLTELVGEEARRHRVRARRRLVRHLRRGLHPRTGRPAQGDHRRGAVGQRSGGGVRRRRHPAQAVRHRADRGDRPVHRQRRGRADHPASSSRCRRSTRWRPAPRSATRSSSRSASRRRARSIAPRTNNVMSQQDSRHRPRRHRLRVRRAAAPDRRPPELHARGRDVRQLARRARGQVVPASRGRARRHRVQVAGGNRRADREGADVRGVLRRAAWRRRRADRLAAQGRRGRGHQAALRRHLGGFPFRHGRGLRSGVQTSARRAASPRAVHLRRARAPEEGAPRRTSAIPGCFSTAILLASVPLLASGMVEPTLFVSGVTGSTGSGRKPVEGTHHPTRHSDLYSYGALGHRHTPEITALAKAAIGRRRGIRLRAAFRSVRARHPRHGAGAPQVAARCRGRRRHAARVLRGLRRSCACSTTRRA